MAAIRRPNKLLEVVNPMEAVLDILSPFLNAADRQAFKGKSTYTRCHEQSICLHSSILSFAVQYNDFRGGAIIGRAKQKGPPETGGPEVSRKCGCYSAATFRGGSSAPESWISA